MKELRFAGTILVYLVGGGLALRATTAPEQIPYQAKIEQAGVPFDGVGKFTFAIVDQSGTNTFWSNDGTSTNGAASTAAVSLNVKGGILNVRLGDASYPNMTPIPAAVFLNADTWLRVWFGGATGASFEKLAPDSKLASVPYALVAEMVPDTSITGNKLALESVWPQHEGRNDCIVTYFAEYTWTNVVTVATIASDKNFIITDVVFSNLDSNSSWNGQSHEADVEIYYTLNAKDTILFKSQSQLIQNGTGGFVKTPTVVTFKGGLVVPAGASLKFGGFQKDFTQTKTCTVTGYEIPVH